MSIKFNSIEEFLRFLEACEESGLEYTGDLIEFVKKWRVNK